MEPIQNIVQKISEYNKIAVLYHVNADGDAIGSALAFSLAFSSCGKMIDIYGEEEVQHQLKFLPSSEKILHDFNGSIIYDLVIVLDSGGLNRLGKRIEIYNSACFKVNIDHHKSNDIDADINWVDEKAAACGEMIYKLIKEAGITINKDTATCLYTALLTDTGSFKYSNTTAQTHRIAADLIEYGVESNEVSKKIYDNIPLKRLKILGRILDTLSLYNNDRISVLYVTSDMMESCGADKEDIDNIANYGLMIENVELSILLKEDKIGQTRVSFRSKNYFDCSELAKQYGGGGHTRAAGCDIDMTVNEARETILYKVYEMGI